MKGRSRVSLSLAAVPAGPAERDSPWLTIPASDYEDHMAAAGQAPVLRAIFGRIYAERQPARLLILGCATGKDFAAIRPEVTPVAVGVDINSTYLARARENLAGGGVAVDLIHGDVLRARVPSSAFDLIYAALILEYVDPPALFRRIVELLARGGVCTVVSQDPAAGVARVTATTYESLRRLDKHMSLFTADEVDAFGRAAGLVRVAFRRVSVGAGKFFSVCTFASRFG